MKDSKTIILLGSLKNSEFKLFKKWMNRYAPDHDEMALFKYLSDYYPTFDKNKIEKRLVYKRVFGGSFNDTKMRNTAFQLSSQLEQFIIHNRTNTDTFHSRYELLLHYQERNESKLFETQLKELKKDLANTTIRNSTFFYRQFLIDSAFNKYLKSKQKRTIEPNIQNVSDNLDLYYIIHKLSVYCEALNYQNIIKAEYEIGFIDELLSQIRNGKMQDVPAVKLYYTALLTLTQSENEQNFYDLKSYLQTFQGIFDEEDINDINTLARNFCIKRINKGDKKFTRDLFDLYQLELQYISPDGSTELSPVTYKNIVTLALNLNETEWTYDFINKYTGYLPEQHRDPNYTYNTARYYFLKKKYGEVISLLSTVEYSDLFMMLSVKILLIKTYYELNESAALESLVQSFKQLLKNKTALGYHRQNYLNFIKFSEKLFKVIRSEKEEIKQLKEEIIKCKALVEKEWFLTNL